MAPPSWKEFQLLQNLSLLTVFAYGPLPQSVCECRNFSSISLTSWPAISDIFLGVWTVPVLSVAKESRGASQIAHWPRSARTQARVNADWLIDDRVSRNFWVLSVCSCFLLFYKKSQGKALRFQASGDAEIKTVPRHFARANQADRCITLLHCTQRLTPWLVDTRGCDRKSWVLFFVWALRDTSTLPVGTWSSALDHSFRSQYNRLLRASQSH